jgi:hypothetical protein
MEFPSEAAARQEASMRAMSQKTSHRLQAYDTYRCIRLRDQTGRIVCEVPVDD